MRKFILFVALFAAVALGVSSCGFQNSKNVEPENVECTVDAPVVFDYAEMENQDYTVDFGPDSDKTLHIDFYDDTLYFTTENIDTFEFVCSDCTVELSSETVFSVDVYTVGVSSIPSEESGSKLFKIVADGTEKEFEIRYSAKTEEADSTDIAE